MYNTIKLFKNQIYDADRIPLFIFKYNIQKAFLNVFKIVQFTCQLTCLQYSSISVGSLVYSADVSVTHCPVMMSAYLLWYPWRSATLSSTRDVVGSKASAAKAWTRREKKKEKKWEACPSYKQKEI